MLKVGILALQGDVREHARALDSTGAVPVPVKNPGAMADVDALIIPGGESTTIGKLLDRAGLLGILKERIESGLPVYGTCAGMILMAAEATGDHPAPYRVPALDITVVRNGYGRQVDSFEADLDVDGLEESFRGVFIRAPVVERTGNEVEVLASHEDRPVLVRQGALLASSFHPEMTDDGRIHELFVEMARRR